MLTFNFFLQTTPPGASDQAARKGPAQTEGKEPGIPGGNRIETVLVSYAINVVV